MSERYGECRTCQGKGRMRNLLPDPVEKGEEIAVFETCDECGGTGHSGDIQDYLNPRSKTNFYSHDDPLPLGSSALPMDLAIQAVKKKWEEERKK